MNIKMHYETKMTPSEWNEMVEQKKFEDKIAEYLKKHNEGKR